MSSPSYEQHVQTSAAIVARCGIITLSDMRTESTDKSGAAIRSLLAGESHSIAHYQIVKDDPAEFEPLLQSLLARADIDVILTNGGTGVSRRDQTIAVVERAIDLPLPGFGELFRMLSWQQIGSGAMLSRASGGVARGKPIFAMPGSTAAVELAMTKLILPELKHLLSILS
jgi:molybdenum cofactor biosynthesis protein B